MCVCVCVCVCVRVCVYVCIAITMVGCMDSERSLVLHGCVCVCVIVYVCTMMYQPYISTCIFLPEQMRDTICTTMTLNLLHNTILIIIVIISCIFDRYLGYWLYICGTIDV